MLAYQFHQVVLQGQIMVGEDLALSWLHSADVTALLTFIAGSKNQTNAALPALFGKT